MAEINNVFTYNVSRAGEVTATDTAFTEAVALDIQDNIQAGEYWLLVTYMWSMPDINDSGLFRLDIGGVVGEVFQIEPKDRRNKAYRSITVPYYHAGGSISFAFNASVTAGGQDMTIEHSSIAFKRVE